MKNPLSHSLISTASLLAFASVVAAQNSQPTEQSGSSLSDVLKNARYEFGRGLTFTSADGESTVNVSGQIQAGYGWSEDNDGNTDSSEFGSDARVRLSGSVWDGNVSYLVQMNPAGGGQGNGDLVDAWVGMHVADGINLRLGQQKMRSGLSADTSANDTDFETVTRSGATDEFANRRATGALLEGAAMEDRLNWHFGIANSTTASYAASNALKAAAGAALAPNGQGNDDTDMMVTAGVSLGSHAGNSESWSEGDLARSGEMQWLTGLTITNDNGAAENYQTINVYGGLKAGNGLAGQVEYWTRDADLGDTTDSGGYVQLSYTMEKSGNMQPGFVARYTTVDWESPLGAGTADLEGTGMTLGVNAYYAAHNLKAQLQYSTLELETGGATTDASSIDLLFTVVF